MADMSFDRERWIARLRSSDIHEFRGKVLGYFESRQKCPFNLPDEYWRDAATMRAVLRERTRAAAKGIKRGRRGRPSAVERLHRVGASLGEVMDQMLADGQALGRDGRYYRTRMTYRELAALYGISERSFQRLAKDFCAWRTRCRGTRRRT